MAVKGIKMDDEALKRVNAAIDASGMDAGDWLESLMALEAIHYSKSRPGRRK